MAKKKRDFLLLLRQTADRRTVRSAVILLLLFQADIDALITQENSFVVFSDKKQRVTLYPRNYVYQALSNH